ncbi:MAG: hydroxymethylbilane synthase [Rhodospirillales bacterium]|nr:hydroxymethylbilane synthase [Rhodospirillales bacterium]
MPASARTPTACLRIGTRGSPLALVQAEEALARLVLTQPALGKPGAAEIVVIKTTGDRILDRPLAEVGGKGLFTKEIDEALLDGRVDLAVHSVKDLPTWLPAPIILAATLSREDPRDALIAPGFETIAALPEGCVVGTSSLRRQAQLLHRRPDLSIVPLRGNVATRLRKVADGTVGATLLAMAGLNRLEKMGRLDAAADLGTGNSDQAIHPVAAEQMLPAAGQAAIGITCREDDEAVRMLLAAVDDRRTHLCVAAERAMLTVLDGSCRTPIAALAVVDDDLATLRICGLIARPDGTRLIAERRRGDADDAQRLGRDLGEALRAEGGAGFFAPAG